MATTIFEKNFVSVTRYCGPGEMPGRDRVRYQLTISNGGTYAAGLTIDDLADLVEAIVKEPDWPGDDIRNDKPAWGIGEPSNRWF